MHCALTPYSACASADYHRLLRSSLDRYCLLVLGRIWGIELHILNKKALGKAGCTALLGICTAMSAAMPAQALIVYRVSSWGLANHRIYQAGSVGEAQCRVAITTDRNAASGQNVWYFTDNPNEADVKIFMTRDRHQATRSVFFTSPGMANGCRL